MAPGSISRTPAKASRTPAKAGIQASRVAKA